MQQTLIIIFPRFSQIDLITKILQSFVEFRISNDLDIIKALRVQGKVVIIDNNLGESINERWLELIIFLYFYQNLDRLNDIIFEYILFTDIFLLAIMQSNTFVTLFPRYDRRV